MKLISKILICYLTCFSSLNLKAGYYDNDMVILGADCSANIQSGVALNIDPADSKFVKMVENGECSGIVYADEEMPRWVAEEIIFVDPTSSYFIKGEEDYGYLGFQDVHDGGTLAPIVVEAELGNNTFSITLNWLAKFLGIVKNTNNYDVDDLPECDPSDLIIQYQEYSEIA
jgi:hypothetical protein